MKLQIKSIVLLLFYCTLFNTLKSYSAVKLPRLVSDGMVLQRDTKSKIWGWGAAGEKVTISFNGKIYQATTGSDGK